MEEGKAADPRTGRRRRFAARLIDFVPAVISGMILLWIGAVVYSLAVGCDHDAEVRTCGDNQVGGAIGLAIILAGFLSPLLYEALPKRTFGKAALDLEIVTKEGEAASRSVRLKRALLVWGPVLAVFAGVLLTDDESGPNTAFLMVWFGYTTLLLLALAAHVPMPWDWLLGTRVEYRPGPGSQAVYARAVKQS